MPRVAKQVGLFDEVGILPLLPSDASNARLVEWSYSRRDLFEHCLRWYYYTYYGASAKTAKSEPLKQELRFLKSLSNRYLRAGDLLHVVIRTYLNRLRQGTEWTADETLRWADKMYQQDREFSLAYRKTGGSNADGRSVLLAEFYFGWPEAERLWEESALRLQQALRIFLVHPEIRELRYGALQSGALVEKNVRLAEDNFRLRGQIDLAWPEGNYINVVDWKIGEASGGEESLQLLSYALVVMQEFDCSPEAVRLSKVHLASALVSPFVVNEAEIERARGRIIQDTERMQIMDRYGREGVVEAFTPCGQARICQMCPFQRICPKE
jgi:hypothetical protein